MNSDREYTTEELNSVFRRIYGSKNDKELKESQLIIIRTLLSGQDSLNILPTGAGKSACYLVPAMLLPGVTLVISPLISLMRDQIRIVRENIPTAGISSEFMVDKTGFHAFNKDGREKVSRLKPDADSPIEDLESVRLTKKRTRDENIFRETIEGQRQPGGATMEKGYKIIFLTPERLRTGQFIRFAERADISMIAVDEAHCISLWGYQFRRRYLEIPRFLRRIRKHPVMAAFTATATPAVKKDIINYLDMKRPVLNEELRKRENLRFKVETIPKDKREEFGKAIEEYNMAGEAERRAKLSNIEISYRMELMKEYALKHADRSGIIYCRTVAQVNHCYNWFLGVEALRNTVTRYYAGLDYDKVNREPGESKEKNWEQFLKNKKRIIITTTALGMGMDKDNVKYVLHAGMPSSLEDYYQEAGRAGRNEVYIKEGECILYYLPVVDSIICKRLIDESIGESGLQGDAKSFRMSIAYNRLNEMERYCRLVLGEDIKKGEETEAEICREDPQEYIIRYFRSYEVCPEQWDAGQAIRINTAFREEVDEIDVLYVNRTKIAQRIRKGMMAGEDVEVGRRGSNLTVSYKISGEKLTYLDMMVADAVYTLLKHGERTIYARNVMELLSGNHNMMMRPERTKQINDSIRKMIRTEIFIDMRRSKSVGFFYDDENPILKGAFLPLKEEKKGFSQIEEAIPPLYEYAEIMNGQFHSFPLPLLKVMLYQEVAEQDPETGKTEGKEITEDKALPASFENLAMTHYLLRSIDSMSIEKSESKSRTTSTIKLYTMVSVLGEFFRKNADGKNCLDNRRIHRIKEKEEQILTHLKMKKYIVHFKPATRIRKGDDTDILIENSIRILRSKTGTKM